MNRKRYIFLAWMQNYRATITTAGYITIPSPIDIAILAKLGRNEGTMLTTFCNTDQKCKG